MTLLMGGDLEVRPRERGSKFSLRLPAITNDFEGDQVFRFSSLSGKKAFVFEPNKSSREVISTCCENNGMIVESVDKVGELSDAISGSRERQDVDIVLIADAPGGRDVERIADICLGVLGENLPLVVLAYRRNCLDLNRYESAVLIKKPFIEDHLVDAMEMVLARDTRHDSSRLPVESVVEDSHL